MRHFHLTLICVASFLALFAGVQLAAPNRKRNPITAPNAELARDLKQGRKLWRAGRLAEAERKPEQAATHNRKQG